MNTPPRFGTSLFTAPLALTLCFLLSGCSSVNPLFCDEGNACNDDELNFCDIGNAYAASTLAYECIARPSGDACNSAEPCVPDSEKSYCTDDNGGVCVACTKNADCDGLLNCDPRTNECTPDIIITCEPESEGDASCLAANDELPYCGPDSICVGCRDNEHCSANAAEAICDPQTFSCRGCLENTECDSRLCGDGVCADRDDIVYVDEDAGSDDAGCGDFDAPCASIGAGIDNVVSGRETVLISEGTYVERIVIANADVVLQGEGDVVVRANLATSEQILTVSGISNVEVRDMELAMLAAPSTADAILCTTSSTTLLLRNVIVKDATDSGVVGDSCNLSLAGTSVEANGGKGVDMTGGTLTVHGSHIQFNADGGIDIDGSNYSLVNNIINNNGGPGSVFGGVRIEGTSARSEEFLFNTIAQNSRPSGATTGSALRCELSNVVASSNIFMLEDTSTAALVTGCATEFSLFDTADVMPAGNGNISAEALFVSPASADYHLRSDSPGIDVAETATGIVVDIDGHDRPSGDGPDMGADETP